MRRLALWLEYDGSRFRGFQRLTRRGDKPSGRGNPRLWPPRQTVQEELECKLSLILGESITLHGSGRTDRGVHASGQIVAFDTTTSKEWPALLGSLNAVLCPGIRAFRAQWVPPTFHPRFSARERIYQYYLWPKGPRHSPFFSPMCWILEEALDLPAMQRAADRLLGSHDFSAYARTPAPDEVMTRELRSLQVQHPVVQPLLPVGPWAQLGEMVCLEVRANAFLRRMVRMLVASLVEVGRGRWSETRPQEVLKARDSGLCAPPAPPQGLFLVYIDYGPELA